MKPERINRIRFDRIQFNKSQSPIHRPARTQRPDAGILLELDQQYRNRVRKGDLPKISPGELDPEPNSALPVLKTEENEWTFTVFYDNTPRAHRENKTRDWVIVHYETDKTVGQDTIVTAESGPLKGRRIVRGRTRDCQKYYNG